MTTIKDLKKWLERFPEDTIVEFLFQQPADRFEAYGAALFNSPKLTDDDSGDGWNLIDFTKYEFVKESDECFGKKYLELGERN